MRRSMKKVNSSFNQRVDLKYDSGISVECVQCGKAGLKGFRRIMEAYGARIRSVATESK